MWPRVADHTEWLFVLIKGAYPLTDLAQRVYIESPKLVLCGCHGNKPVLLCHVSYYAHRTFNTSYLNYCLFFNFHC